MAHKPTRKMGDQTFGKWTIHDSVLICLIVEDHDRSHQRRDVAAITADFERYCDTKRGERAPMERYKKIRKQMKQESLRADAKARIAPVETILRQLAPYELREQIRRLRSLCAAPMLDRGAEQGSAEMESTGNSTDSEDEEHPEVDDMIAEMGLEDVIDNYQWTYDFSAEGASLDEALAAFPLTEIPGLLEDVNLAGPP